MKTFIFEGNEYDLIKNIIFNNKEYLYYVSHNDYKTYIICEYKNDKVVVVEDKKLLSKLVLELYKTNNYKE